jgi:Tfp pilus assembly protein PilO
MLTKITEFIPASSLIILFTCLGGIALFVFLLILPRQDMAAALDESIGELEKKIGEQRTLTPVFHNILAKAKIKEKPELPITQKTKLARRDMIKIFDQIKAIARMYNLKLQEITPDVNSLKETSGYLLIRLVVTGNFFNFREFLIDMGAIPSMVHIEEMQIRSIEESREIKLKVWLAQE